jgi:uncharacterized protein GlcG (DUF336 family)
MNQEVVQKTIQAAIDEATRLGVPITVSIVDMGGHLVALQRMEGCSFLGLESSRKKAITASQLNSPTHALGEIEQKFPPLQRAFDKDPMLLTIPGGFPINLARKVIGGFGISGGNFEQDKAIAQKVAQSLL